MIDYFLGFVYNKGGFQSQQEIFIIFLHSAKLTSFILKATINCRNIFKSPIILGAKVILYGMQNS